MRVIHTACQSGLVEEPLAPAGGRKQDQLASLLKGEPRPVRYAGGGVIVC